MTDIPVRLLNYMHLEVLRHLECPPLNDMDILLQCPALTSIAIQMEELDTVETEHEVNRVRGAIKDTVTFLKQDNKV